MSRSVSIEKSVFGGNKCALKRLLARPVVPVSYRSVPLLPEPTKYR